VNLRRVKRALIRANPHCDVEGCGNLDLELDHRLPLRDGGTNDRSNLRLLCVDHHRVASASATNDPT
jgi:5-methylcytosine-specific restriction endonuclease McrA